MGLAIFMKGGCEPAYLSNKSFVDIQLKTRNSGLNLLMRFLKIGNMVAKFITR